ncbi:hypothetical protein BKA67DRAFT_533298 [Truncatella angustata]|uniref:ADF-H domain-containing protein n=1 Tax=Truncatella angustata TaxID=152316 RepID=A0A9P8UTL2_9PEZI|nr:uncharacterized protein BKA67DRAFT_533298 [Truncatella angustata]KAH6658124.1 hypothetical protein BKA67DRAFT_533298 [Truncatella angustata]
MSLNGLDNATVREAHEAAVAEHGGWFLLKYASRDEVDVYSRGTGGIVEMRNAIANYEESSPLYGFLKYRRRNVILKFQPDGCSRLIQARATVHFNAVCERFTPYNTTFEITEAKELKDTKLSAACSLHAASGSSSSSTSSLRRRRLMEIAEEEEEEERERKRQSIVQEEERPSTAGDQEFRTPLSSPEPPVVLDKEQIDSPKEPNFASTAEKPSFEGVRPTSPTRSEYESRLSSQTARPDLYSYSSYPYGKPRVKLGPRPSLESNKKPQTASNFRPVAALPAGFKLAPKGQKKGRSGSQDQTAGDEDQDHEQETETEELAPLNASVTIPEAPHESEAALLPPRPNTSSGASLKSISSIAPVKESKMTPEKARLMKAMKLRQQQKKSSLMATEPSAVSLPPGMDNEAIPEDKTEDSSAIGEPDGQEKEDQYTLAHADSAIAVDPPTPMTVDIEVMEDTLTDSHPPSPTAASSDIGESTKASSLSESTDETVQATKEGNFDDDGEAVEHDLQSLGETHEAALLTSPALDAETHDDDNILAQDDGPLAREFDSIPQNSQLPAESRKNDMIRESVEIDEPAVETLDITPQEVVLPPPQDDEAASPKSPYGIPVSRFASNDSKSPTTPSLKSRFSTHDLKSLPEPVPNLPTLVTPPTLVAADSQPLPVKKVERSEALTSEPFETAQSKPARRNPSISPINTELARQTPDSELPDPLHDDDLMDELQSATFEEAQPMRFSKSPITPVFPSTSPKRPQTVGSNAPLTRAFSNPMRGPLLAPGDVSSSSARSVSAGGAALLHNVTRQPSSAGLSTKKATGGSIAQRIKALQQLSGDGSKDVDKTRPRTAGPSTSFINVRQPNARDSSKSPVPSLADRTTSLTRQTTLDPSREGSPELLGGLQPPRSRAGSMAKRMSMFETGAPPNRGRPESIQVTARIVRDGNTSFPKRPSSKDPVEYNTADLKQSPLVVDHLKAVPEPVRANTIDVASLPTIEAPKDTIQERRLSRDRKASVTEDDTGKKRRSSLSIVKDFIKDRRSSVTSNNKPTDNLAVLSPTPSNKAPSRPPSVHQTSGGSLGRRLSISSRRSSVSKEQDNSSPLLSPTPTIDNSSDDTDKASLGDKKSQSRTSRFMRRLSNTLVATRKSAAPNTPTTVREEEEVVPDVSPAHSRNPSQPTLTSYMGDVNVQFPDNLLWKRRSMCLDTQGFLVLSPINNGTEKTGVSTKRFHMSDFRTPYVPDVDMQELPNSICLDFVGGSALQLACGDRHGQTHTLHALQEAHHKHSSFGQ